MPLRLNVIARPEMCRVDQGSARHYYIGNMTAEDYNSSMNITVFGATGHVGSSL